ncbi:uncharacterized protein LOC127858872 [Dreissena polymorpha]|uniref:uncharacterized protein LOC127858872 n=1 Tax=Dreissena polymorpha TaxID=45954 RepID=UPI0022647BE5|nr:uncharacterized protein LOC127858872 [Dreissena polymorpha]
MDMRVHEPVDVHMYMNHTFLFTLTLLCVRNCLAFQSENEILASEGDTINLECDAIGGFQIHFTQSNKENVIIGGCTSFGGCYLTTATLIAKYSLRRTKNGGELILRNIGNGHYGNYTCTEVFDETKSVSVLVSRKENMVVNGCNAHGALYSALTFLTHISLTYVLRCVLLLFSLMY